MGNKRLQLKFGSIKLGWYLKGVDPPFYFNAGMFVFEPSPSTYDSLLEAVKISQPTPFAEQDLLNIFFHKVYKPIPLVYNLVLAMLWRHPEKVELDKVEVVHYCAAGSKPWRYTGKEVHMDREDIKMFVAKWLDIYNDESLDYKNVEKPINISSRGRTDIFIIKALNHGLNA